MKQGVVRKAGKSGTENSYKLIYYWNDYIWSVSAFSINER